MNTELHSSYSAFAGLPFTYAEVDTVVFHSVGDAMAYAQQLWYQEQKSVSVLFSNKGYYIVVDLTESMRLTKDKRYQLVVAYI